MNPFRTSSPSTLPSFIPLHFIRCHSREKSDSADVQTAVWDVAFDNTAPSASSASSESMIATCGGNSVCVIDVDTGKVVLKYDSTAHNENYFTLSWTRMRSAGSSKASKALKVLAVGGQSGQVRLLETTRKVCYYYWELEVKEKRKKAPQVSVHSVKFHTERPTWLFCGTSDGCVSLWDIGIPKLPAFSGVKPQRLFRLDCCMSSPVNNMVLTGGSVGWLLAGTGTGIVGWNIDCQKIDEKDYNPQTVDFSTSESFSGGDNIIVDAIGLVDPGTVVSKVALSGYLDLWDLRATVAKLESSGDREEVEVVPLTRFKWSDTDDYYMNVGCGGDGLVACGDGNGAIWLYQYPTKEKEDSGEAFAKLDWPQLEDPGGRKVGKDIIVNKVAVSGDGNFLVAVTSKNFVCIWKNNPN